MLCFNLVEINMMITLIFNFDKSGNGSALLSLVLIVKNVRVKFVSCGLEFQVVSHKDFKTREEFDEAVHQVLVAKNIDIICLAGFMRILSGIV